MKALGVIKASQIAVVICATIISKVVSAEMPSYDILGLSVVKQSVEGELDNFNGFGIVASKQLASNFFIGATYSSLDNSTGSEIYRGDLHFGLFTDLKYIANTRVATVFGYTKASFDRQYINPSDEAGFIGVSLRSRVYNQVELRTGLHYLDWKLAESGFRQFFGVSYFAAGGLTVSMDFNQQDDTQEYSMGVAYHF